MSNRRVFLFGLTGGLVLSGCGGGGAGDGGGGTAASGSLTAGNSYAEFITNLEGRGGGPGFAAAFLPYDHDFQEFGLGPLLTGGVQYFRPGFVYSTIAMPGSQAWDPFLGWRNISTSTSLGTWQLGSTAVPRKFSLYAQSSNGLTGIGASQVFYGVKSVAYPPNPVTYNGNTSIEAEVVIFWEVIASLNGKDLYRSVSLYNGWVQNYLPENGFVFLPGTAIFRGRYTQYNLEIINPDPGNPPLGMVGDYTYVNVSLV